MLMIILGLTGVFLTFAFLFKGDPLRKTHALITMFIFLFVSVNYAIVLYDKNIADIIESDAFRTFCMRPMIVLLTTALLADVILWRWKR